MGFWTAIWGRAMTSERFDNGSGYGRAGCHVFEVRRRKFLRFWKCLPFNGQRLKEVGVVGGICGWYGVSGSRHM